MAAPCLGQCISVQIAAHWHVNIKSKASYTEACCRGQHAPDTPSSSKCKQLTVVPRSPNIINRDLPGANKIHQEGALVNTLASNPSRLHCTWLLFIPVMPPFLNSNYHPDPTSTSWLPPQGSPSHLRTAPAVTGIGTKVSLWNTTPRTKSHGIPHLGLTL